MTYKLTIVCADEDSAKAEKLALVLGQEGIAVEVATSNRLQDETLPVVKAGSGAAKNILVLWSASSTGAAGKAVCDVARAAQLQECLLQALIAKTPVPDEFTSQPAINLAGWKGSAKNPFFQELLKAIHTLEAGGVTPTAIGRVRRMRRRVFAGVTTTTLMLALSSFGADLLSVQQNVCSLSWSQPGLSDMCGSFGFGGKPKKAERMAWAAREPNSCDALRDHVRVFPNGVFRSKAADYLEARTITPHISWAPAERALPLFITKGSSTQTTEATARTDAESRAGPDAEKSCKGYATGTLFKYVSASYRVESWHCSTVSDGAVCGFSGEAVCQLEARKTEETESCPGVVVAAVAS